jgi:amino acid transporter
MAASPSHKNLKKSLSMGTLAMAMFCCVSGGPFGLEEAVSASGPSIALLLIAILPFIWALPDALTSAELAAALPYEGGYVVWVRRALGPFWGFLNAWWTWIYALVDVSIYPVLFTTYLSAILKLHFGWSVLETNDGLRWAISGCIVALFTALNIRGTRLVGTVGTGFAALIIVPFALMAVVGVFQMAGQGMAVSLGGTQPDASSASSAIAAGLGIVMWNYLGWDQLSTVAEEVENPGRAYPRAIFIALPLVTALYFVPTLIGLQFVPEATQWTEGAWPMIAQRVGGPWLQVLMTVASLVSPMALFMASMLATTRVPFVLAEEGFLPRGLVEIHPKFGTPWKAILLQGGINVLLVQKSFQELVTVNVVLYGSALCLEQVSLLILRIKEPLLERPFKIPGGWPVVGLVVILPISVVAAFVVLSIQEEGLAAQGFTIASLVSAPLLYGVISAVKGRR